MSDAPFGEIGILGELLGVKMRHLAVLLNRAFAAATASRQLRLGVISSLALIVSRPGITQNELAKLTGWDKSRVVGVVDKLEELGWATRTASETDRRIRHLQATRRGISELEKLIAAVKKVENEMLAMIPREDLDYLGDVLDRMMISCANHARGTGAVRAKKT